MNKFSYYVTTYFITSNKDFNYCRNLSCSKRNRTLSVWGPDSNPFMISYQVKKKKKLYLKHLIIQEKRLKSQNKIKNK